MLYRWFVGLSMDDAAWDHSTYTKNRDRLIEHEVVRALLGGRHPAVELRFEILRPGAGFGYNRYLKIVHAELRNVALLLMVGGIGLDLEGNPCMRHCSDVRLQEKM